MIVFNCDKIVKITYNNGIKSQKPTSKLTTNEVGMLIVSFILITNYTMFDIML